MTCVCKKCACAITLHVNIEFSWTDHDFAQSVLSLQLSLFVPKVPILCLYVKWYIHHHIGLPTHQAVHSLYKERDKCHAYRAWHVVKGVALYMRVHVYTCTSISPARGEPGERGFIFLLVDHPRAWAVLMPAEQLYFYLIDSGLDCST